MLSYTIYVYMYIYIYKYIYIVNFDRGIISYHCHFHLISKCASSSSVVFCGAL